MWTPEDERYFVGRVANSPDSESREQAAHMFADWLESVGRPAHAELIRLHHANEFTRRSYPGGDISRYSPSDPFSRVKEATPYGYMPNRVEKSFRIDGQVDSGGREKRLSFWAYPKNFEHAQLLHRALQEESGE